VNRGCKSDHARSRSAGLAVSRRLCRSSRRSFGHRSTIGSYARGYCRGRSVAELDGAPAAPRFPPPSSLKSRDFLRRLDDDNLPFLGYPNTRRRSVQTRARASRGSCATKRHPVFGGLRDLSIPAARCAGLHSSRALLVLSEIEPPRDGSPYRSHGCDSECAGSGRREVIACLFLGLSPPLPIAAIRGRSAFSPQSPADRHERAVLSPNEPRRQAPYLQHPLPSRATAFP